MNSPTNEEELLQKLYDLIGSLSQKELHEIAILRISYGHDRDAFIRKMRIYMNFETIIEAVVHKIYDLMSKVAQIYGDDIYRDFELKLAAVLTMRKVEQLDIDAKEAHDMHILSKTQQDRDVISRRLLKAMKALRSDTEMVDRINKLATGPMASLQNNQDFDENGNVIYY